MTTRLNVKQHLSHKVIDMDNPTDISREDINTVVRVLMNNNAYTIMDNIEGRDMFGTAPKMNGRVKSSLIDLETVVAFS